MKGVVLAGGLGSRLLPLTIGINKHLLPVGGKPMIYHPILTLKNSGITDIMVVLGGNSCGEIIQTLGMYENTFGVKITYRYQSKPDGIAGALKLAKDFIGDDNMIVCLGDNIFENYIPNVDTVFSELQKKSTLPMGMVFLSPTDKPESFGVPTLTPDGKLVKITEKPINPDSNFAVTGLYIYDKNVWDVLDTLSVSGRNEYEITDVNNFYLQNGVLEYKHIEGYWHDAGSIEALFEANKLTMMSRTNGLSE